MKLESRVSILVAIFTILTTVPPASGRTPADWSRRDLPVQAEEGGRAAVGSAAAASLSAVDCDTTYYGGTVWAADSSRWEALRGGTWTFDSGIGSSTSPDPAGCKPPGYHSRLEGWVGLDRSALPEGGASARGSYFRRSMSCAVSGVWSFWSGVAAAEADSLCFAAGQGYGNGWATMLAQTFHYPGSGSVTLSYAYAVDSEPMYDYFHVRIDTTGTGAAADIELTRYDGLVSGTATSTLLPGTTMRSTSGPVTIKFTTTSDYAYSDEDGLFPSACGLAAVDDIHLSGAISSFSNFEAGEDGWHAILEACGDGGEWSDLRSLGTLPPPLSFCRCAMADSVLIFADTAGYHDGLNLLDNVALSPWIDLAAGGDVGRPGRFIQFDGYFELPLTNYIFVQTLAQWYPHRCSNGRITMSSLTSDGFVRYFTGQPNCSLPGAPQRVDFSAVVPLTAEQLRIAVGVISLCSMFANCTGVTNSTPWFDNIRFGIYDVPGAPVVSLPSIDQLQDCFSSDGSLVPTSTGRIDIALVKGAALPAPGTSLGDTLVVIGDGGNQEVRVVFRVRQGPSTSSAALNAWATSKWTPESMIGPGWYSARLDTAEQGGVVAPGRWMGTLHESDPKFGGGSDTDRGGDQDGNQLSHDIFPDHLLTAGSRIDYFVTARFLPPDPRNPGGTQVRVVPDTANGSMLEMEILPSSMQADSTWNCVLLVDHHADTNPDLGAVEESGLTAIMPPRPGNAEGTRYDRYDVNASTSAQVSFGRPQNTQYGASTFQTFAYKGIVWHSGVNAAYNLVDEDANTLSFWLTITEVGYNRFWGTGNGLVRSMASEFEPTTIQFLEHILGVRYSCDTIRLAGCPAGSLLDSTYCLPLSSVPGATFVSSSPGSLRGNGCPELRSYDLLNVHTSVPTAKGQLYYLKSGSPVAFASVTNHNSVDADYRTVVDGFANGLNRELAGDSHDAGACADGFAARLRTIEVLGWLRNRFPDLCTLPAPPCYFDCTSDVPDGPAAPRSVLLPPVPNPFSESTRIAYGVGSAAGEVRLQVFDVTGRLVRGLVESQQKPGRYQVEWDGRDDRGRRVSEGLYFARLVIGSLVLSNKVILAR